MNTFPHAARESMDCVISSTTIVCNADFGHMQRIASPADTLLQAVAWLHQWLPLCFLLRHAGIMPCTLLSKVAQLKASP
ncbi:MULTISPECIES: hypothetical protein [unclassified Novosphingobium]|uniref:hypothetical protein n=1 Tax=unclassified Novosphingobium TaxID=2644732 RepID=UPI00146B363F|nr:MULTISPECIES: hypothetical protein [unclassified Novosphingobium]NMN04269.1 hypothetical protein [Novosphingobium sp. SG919]NMN85740.1 hypothetical protein [Novosphingobium sp. SG916]